MQAPLLAQPDNRASLERDWVIWADGCIKFLLRRPVALRPSVLRLKLPGRACET